MDYFVFGIGFGASLVLLGWALRQFGPGLRFRKTDSGRDVLSAEEMLIRHDWARFCISLGGLLSIAGAVVLLTTIVTLLIRPSDRAGSIVAGALFVLVLVGVAAWIGLFLSQHQGLGFRRGVPAQLSARQRPTRDIARENEYDGKDELDEEPVAANQASPANSAQPTRVRVRPTVRPGAQVAPADTDSNTDRADQNDTESGTVDESPAAESATTPPATEHTPTQSFRGVRFARPQHHETDRPSDTESVARASTASDEASAGTEGSASESIADDVKGNDENDASPEQTSPGAADVGGDDIVSSVTVRESRTDNAPGDSTEKATPLAEDKNEPVSSADAFMHHDVALANLRLRRINRSVHKDT